MRRLSALAAIAVLVGFLTGCGSREGRYCGALAEEKSDLIKLADQKGGDVLAPTLQSFERLRSLAPGELTDEWDTLVFAYQALADAVAAAGVDPADYDPAKRPAGVTAQQARRLAAVAAKLGSTRVQEAAAGIQDHAQQVCDVDFRS